MRIAVASAFNLADFGNPATEFEKYAVNISKYYLKKEKKGEKWETKKEDSKSNWIMWYIIKQKTTKKDIKKKTL